MSTVPARPSRLLTYAGYYAFVLIGWNIVLIPSLIRSMEHDFRQGDAGFGLLFLLGSAIYASGAFLGGLVTERLGRRWVLCAGATALGGGFAGVAFAPGWIPLLLAIVPVNAGAGIIDGGVNGLFLDLYRDARGGALNLLHLFFSLGALVAPFVIGQLVTAGAGWRAIVAGVGVGALPLLLALAVVPMPHGRREQAAAVVDDGDVSPIERSPWPFAGLALAILLYVASEVAVSNWLVKFLAAVPLATATAILSVLWAGIAVGRLLSRWLAERIDYFVFTIACALLAGLTLAGAVVSPWLAASAILFGVTGVFFGPIYPMIMALGGNIYPHRLSALSGGLGAAAVAGGMIYPPLMGLLAARIGLGAGLLGAASLGLPTALAVAAVAVLARRDSVHRAAPSRPARQTGTGR